MAVAEYFTAKPTLRQAVILLMVESACVDKPKLATMNYIIFLTERKGTRLLGITKCVDLRPIQKRFGQNGAKICAPSAAVIHSKAGATLDAGVLLIQNDHERLAEMLCGSTVVVIRKRPVPQ